MLSKVLTERELIQSCIGEICRKAGFVGMDGLVQRDLQLLCDRIEASTGVLISLSTMRRLVNGQFSRLPQVATLDAIAGYAGYGSWQGLRTAKQDEAPVDGESADTISEAGTMISREGDAALTEERPGPIRLRNRVRSAFFAGGLLLAAVGLLAIVLRKPGPGPIDKAEFSAVKVTQNELPNTVVFHYDIDAINADSFFIQQSWDKHRRVRIYKNTHTLTDIYYEPGYHTAKLFANDQIIRTVDVSIPTDRWFFYAKEGGFYGQPRYISGLTPGPHGVLQILPADLAASGIDIQKENCYAVVYFPTLIQYNSDDFTFSFKIRMHAVNNVSCPYFMGEVFCQKNFIYFENTSRGCTSNIQAQFGDKVLNGKTHDLSTMGLDLTAWQNVQLRVQHRTVRISINGVDVLNTDYHESCGLITGLGFTSNGLCEVDAVDLRTGDGKIVCGKAEIPQVVN